MASVYRKTYTRPLSELPPDTRIAARKGGERREGGPLAGQTWEEA
jgi:hypothetical protein